jgi:cephalosporin hydroxylase
MIRRGWRAVAFRLKRRRDRETMRRAARLFYRSGGWSETYWLGTQTLKNPLDLWVYQEIITETRPDVIIETGTYRGGSAYHLASICELLGHGRVVSIDRRPVSGEYPQHSRITYLGGKSSTHPGVVEAVRQLVGGGRAMVILDSDHSQAYVEAELAAYANFVAPGCYLVVEDSNIGEVSRDLMPGPMQAIESFLAKRNDFGVDTSRERFMITFNPRGYLKRQF